MIEPLAIELGVLALAGVIGGWINTIAGAGSLLLLPALIFTGLPADAANATNRIGILAQTAAAFWGYRREGIRIGKSELALTLAAMSGGAIGAFVASLLGDAEVRVAIVVAMSVMLVLSLVPRKTSEPKPLPPPSPAMFGAFFAIGIYGGFLQAGVGIVVLLYLSAAYSVSLVASNVLKNTVTLGLTLVAMGVFLARGEAIDWLRGAVLAVATAGGGFLGARATVKGGERVVRAMVVIAVLASMTKLVLDLLAPR